MISQTKFAMTFMSRIFMLRLVAFTLMFDRLKELYVTYLFIHTVSRLNLDEPRCKE